MKIVTTSYAHPITGDMRYGAERAILYNIQEFIKVGHEVTLLCNTGSNVPGCKMIYAPERWNDHRDIYWEIAKDLDYDIFHSWMPSGYIDYELRQRPYCLEPFMSFKGFKENIIAYSHKTNAVIGGHCTVIQFGIPDAEPCFSHKDYLAWIARIDPGKCPTLAIDVAKRTGKKLVIMGPAQNYGYFRDQVWPHVDNQQIYWLDAVDDETKHRVLRNACCTLVTNWNHYHEYFAITITESLRAGTPVIGWGRKTEPSAVNLYGNQRGEIYEHGKHGFIEEYDDYSLEEYWRSVERASEYVRQIGNIKREECRKLYEDKFTAERMAQQHLAYFNIVRERGQVYNVTNEIN